MSGYPSMPCRSDPGVGGGCGGWVSQHALQVSPGGGSGPGGSPIFRGGVSNFSGGAPIFWGLSNFGGLRGDPQFFFFISAFFGDTVNVRPVRILLECILVSNVTQVKLLSSSSIHMSYTMY